MLQSLMAASVWHTQRERNTRWHQGPSKPAEEVLKEVIYRDCTIDFRVGKFKSVHRLQLENQCSTTWSQQITRGRAQKGYREYEAYIQEG